MVPSFLHSDKWILNLCVCVCVCVCVKKHPVDFDPCRYQETVFPVDGLLQQLVQHSISHMSSALLTAAWPPRQGGTQNLILCYILLHVHVLKKWKGWWTGLSQMTGGGCQGAAHCTWIEGWRCWCSHPAGSSRPAPPMSFLETILPGGSQHFLFNRGHAYPSPWAGDCEDLGGMSGCLGYSQCYHCCDQCCYPGQGWGEESDCRWGGGERPMQF